MKARGRGRHAASIVAGVSRFFVAANVFSQATTRPRFGFGFLNAIAAARC